MVVRLVAVDLWFLVLVLGRLVSVVVVLGIAVLKQAGHGGRGRQEAEADGQENDLS